MGGVQRGNVLVLLALALPALIGVAGLAVDWGMGAWTKTQLQNTADAAALAGCGYLPNSTLAGQKATAIVTDGFGNPTSTTFAANGYQYTVTLTDNVSTYFMRVFGYNSINVTAHATALAHNPIGAIAGHGFPSAIINPNLNSDSSDDFIPDNYGRPYIINYGPNNTMVQDWANEVSPLRPTRRVGTPVDGRPGWV